MYLARRGYVCLGTNERNTFCKFLNGHCILRLTCVAMSITMTTQLKNEYLTYRVVMYLPIKNLVTGRYKMKTSMSSHTCI